MQCIFFDRVDSENGHIDRNKIKCKTGFEDYTPTRKALDKCLYDSEFLKCPRFVARTMINNQNIKIPDFSPNNKKPNELFVPSIKVAHNVQCIFLNFEKVDNSIIKHDCKSGFQRYEVEEEELFKYCVKDEFFNCPRFKACVQVLNLQAPTPT